MEKLKLSGAVVKNNLLVISESILTELNHLHFRWLLAADCKKDTFKIPVYLNTNCTEILFTAQFQLEEGALTDSFIQKGVAMIANG